MELSKLLDKFKHLEILEKMLNVEKEKLKEYVLITKGKHNGVACYVVSPKKDFYDEVGAISTKIYINAKLDIIDAECGCLQFYRKKECLHVTLLYAMAIRRINEEIYYEQISSFKKSTQVNAHKSRLNKLADDLRTSSSFFQKIHLTPEIIVEKNDTYLGLHIKCDKEYVVKSIAEFIQNVETNKYYEYGQKLAFIHSYEVLDEESRELYSFIVNIIDENSSKNIKIKRSHFLKVLEICRQGGIYYTANNKTNSFSIKEINHLDLILDDRSLFIDKPAGFKELICGINNAYFIGESEIYYYKFRRRNEALIFAALFKCYEKELLIEANEIDFISNLLPVLKRDVVIKDSFYDKYKLPDVDITSCFIYQNGMIVNDYKIVVDEKYRNTPYVSQILEGYYQNVEVFNFIKNTKSQYHLDKAEDQYRFLTSDISSLKNYGEVYFDESIKKIKLKKSNKVNINITYNVGLLDFKFEGGKLSLEEVKAMLNAYHEKKKIVKLKDDVIIEIRDEDIKPLENFLEDFNIDLEDISNGVSKPLNYILKLVGAQEDTIIYDDQICQMIDTIQNYKNSKSLPVEPFINVLRPYQLEAFKWLKMLSDFKFGGILADDMGLGKTLEIISFLASDEASKPTLIVCPMSLIYNWQNECEKWKFQMPVNLVIGGAEAREAMISSINYNQKSIYITSYDSLRRDVELYKGEFRFVIADEAQYIKNQNALKSTAIKQLKSEMNYALTGTPIENGLADLWSIFDYLMPGYLANYNHFKNRYESLIMHDDDEALTLLKKRVQPFILRRTKKDVLKDLPEKSEQIYYCKMEEDQQKIYDGYVAQIKSEINENKQVLALITRLRQICITPELIFEEKFVSAKLMLAVELIERAISAGHRILVFSQFPSVFSIIGEMIAEREINYFTLDGSTKALKRMEMVDEFNRNEKIKVFLISLKAGGTGLNLVGADMVIHLDPWWNVSVENQATDRVYRIGQTRNVHVLKLVCKDTIEEKVIKLQKAKSELASSIIHSEDQNIKLNKNDILELLD